ncbi:hypothetical protein LO772_16885 [Yinghuangia sp. ASG 101]|uniref:hypothetical protein n=1 Tax=Yinghuangia sp. ASG 101 TaxID=2896848 RepID=UPI001E48E1F2|nr:hypothetical protein [Yinghuangia sp. ASG 101]UGQ15089.1 hypothetical protein LO772_16885 [Yinghuangia sp. ASG 101]
MRLTDGVRMMMHQDDPAPPHSDELSTSARFTLEDILVSRPDAVSARTGVGPTPRRIPTGRARRGWILAFGLAIVASTGVAVSLDFPEPKDARLRGSVYCYTDTDVGADPPHGIETMRVGVPDAAATAVEQCADLWRNGTLEHGARTGIARPAPGPDRVVPSLVVCVVRDTAAVFPAGPGFCHAAGLPPLEVFPAPESGGPAAE